MKILICDYKDELKRNLDYEKNLLMDKFHECKVDDVTIEVCPYECEEQLIDEIKDVDVLLTAFIPINKHVLENATKLKCISINATGYGNVDIYEAGKRNIAVCNVKEYCTQEVAEHTMALMLSMVRGLKVHEKNIENGVWNYQNVCNIERLAGKTLAIFGLGRIGQAVAKRAKGFDLNIIAVDPYLPKEIGKKLGVKLVSKEEALRQADIISNHMNATSQNKSYFSIEEFKSMERKPYFLNIGRGECVDEEALLEALNKKMIRGAALDVLREENPDLKNNPLLSCENLYLTPHAAFYSETSMKELQRISCENIIYYMTNQEDKVFSLVNSKELKGREGSEYGFR